MATESGSYDDATLQRRAAMAQAMMGPRKQPITHWAEGLAELGNGFLGGYQLAQVDKDRKAEKAAERAELYTAAGLPAPAAPAASPSGFQKIASLLSGGGETAPASPAAPAAAPPVAPSVPAAMAPDYGNAIAGIESGGKYDKLGPVTKGDRAYGKYQVMGNNIPEWTQAALGQSMTPQQFLASPEAQDAVFKNRFGGYVDKYGPEGAAKAWFAGEKGMNNPNAKDILGTTVEGYGKKFTNALGGQQPYQVAGPSTAAPQAPVAQAMTPPQMPAGAPAGMFAGVPKEQLPALLSGLTSKNPTMRAMAVQQLGNYTKASAPTDDIREFEYGQRNPAFAKRQEDLKKAGKAETTVNVGGGSDKQIFDTMDESAKAARTTAQGLSGLREARNAIQGGAITGAGADARLALQKAGALIGVTDPSKIVNTETFRSAIAPQVAAVLKSTVGTANISNTDREFAEKAAGSNINLDEKSITRLLDIMERASTAQLEGHQKRLDKVYADPEKFARERALFGVDMPAPPAIAAPAAPPAAAASDRSAIEAEMRKRGLLK